MATKMLRRHRQCISEHILEQWSGPRQGRAAVLLVDTSKVVQEQQRSTGNGSSRNKQLLLSEASEDWRGGAVGDAGAEVTMVFRLKLACLYTQVQALGSTDT